MKTMFLLTALIVSLSLSIHGEAVKDREGAVRGDKAKLESDARWNYNDVDAGFRLAKQTGKPLLVILRCIPCMSCMGIDTSVLEEPALLLD